MRIAQEKAGRATAVLSSSSSLSYLSLYLLAGDNPARRNYGHTSESLRFESNRFITIVTRWLYFHTEFMATEYFDLKKRFFWLIEEPELSLR